MASVSERPASMERGLAITKWTEAAVHLKSSRLSERGLISYYGDRMDIEGRILLKSFMRR